MYYRNISVIVLTALLIGTGCQTLKEKERENALYLRTGDDLYDKADYKMAYKYYSQGIPLLLMPKEGDGGSRYYGGRIRIEQAAGGKKEMWTISIDTKGEECFYKAMDCLVRMDPDYYSRVFSNYERYIDVFPNYSGMDEVERNIKHIISRFEIKGEVEGAIRGYRLLLKIDPFSLEGRNAHFVIGKYYFNQEKFLLAIEYYKDILVYFPNESRIPEVLFQLGVSHFRLFKGLYYDFDDIETSERYFKRFIKKSDDEKNLKLARMYIEDIRDKKAAKLLYKAEFYLRRGAVAAARGYLKEVQKEYASTKWEGRAAELIKALPDENEDDE